MEYQRTRHANDDKYLFFNTVKELFKYSDESSTGSNYNELNGDTRRNADRRKGKNVGTGKEERGAPKRRCRGIPVIDLQLKSNHFSM